MSNNISTDRPENLLRFTRKRATSVVMQSEAAECGLACLAMIAGFYGLDTDLTTLRRKYGISVQGATLKDVMNIAGKMKLTSRALKLEIDELEQLHLPCILHWEMKHFVVLTKVTKNYIVINDPAVGECKYSMEEVGKLFTGIALEITPGAEFEPKTDKNTLTFQHFWSRIVGLKSSLSVVLLLSIVLQLLTLLSPFYLQTIVDDVLLRSDFNLLTVLAFGFFLLLLIETGIGFLREYVVLNLSSRLNIQMSANVFRHLINLPMDYFSKRHLGDVVSRFSSLSAIRELLTTGVVATVLDGIMALITLTVMFFYDATLTFVVLITVTLYALARILLYRPLKQLSQESIVARAKENSHFMETVRAIQTIKLFEKETDRQGQWQNKLADVINKRIDISKWSIGISSGNAVLFGLENIIVIYLAAHLVMDNLMTVGMLYAFLSYKSRFTDSMNGLINNLIEFRMLEVHFDRLADLVFTETDKYIGDKNETDVHRSDKVIRGDIEVSDLAYKYSESTPFVFANLNFKIKAGETVAITGPSGCGKSTLMRCLMGLMAPAQGTILIDDTPLEQLSDYRSQIAGVMQDDQLLSGSIMDNITCFENTVDLRFAMECASRACIHDEISAMPMQYNTLVGDLGSSLSGGQKQRLLLARAFYRKPRILFMDEATSHLDAENEKRINEQIGNLNITRVIIAHRQETIKSAQRVFQLRKTGIKENVKP